MRVQRLQSGSLLYFLRGIGRSPQCWSKMAPILNSAETTVRLRHRCCCQSTVFAKRDPCAVGWTPLHYAADNNMVALAEVLLEKRANLNARTKGMLASQKHCMHRLYLNHPMTATRGFRWAYARVDSNGSSCAQVSCQCRASSGPVRRGSQSPDRWWKIGHGDDARCVRLCVRCVEVHRSHSYA